MSSWPDSTTKWTWLGLLMLGASILLWTVVVAIGDGGQASLHAGHDGKPTDYAPIEVELAIHDSLLAGEMEERVAIEPSRQEGEFLVRVLTSSDQSPLASATVTLRGGSSFACDDNGEVRLLERPREFDVHCRNYRSLRGLEMPRGSRQMDVTLGDGAVLRGHGLGPNETVIFGEVWIQRPGSMTLEAFASVSPADGSFEVRGLTPGEGYSVHFVSPGYVCDPVHVRVEHEESLQLKADRLLACLVKFRDQYGEPIRAAMPEVGVVIRRPKDSPARRLPNSEVPRLAPWITQEELQVEGHDFLLAYRCSESVYESVPVQLLIALPGFERAEDSVDAVASGDGLQHVQVVLESTSAAKGGISIELLGYEPRVDRERGQLGSVFLSDETGWTYEFEVESWGDVIQLDEMPLGSYELWYESPSQISFDKVLSIVEHSSVLTHAQLDLSRFGALRINWDGAIDGGGRADFAEVRLEPEFPNADISFHRIARGGSELHFLPSGNYTLKIERAQGFDPISLEVKRGQFAELNLPKQASSKE